MYGHVNFFIWGGLMHPIVQRSFWSVFINLRSAECVCSYYGLRVWL